MANTLQEKIAQMREEAEKREAQAPSEEKGGKTLFQRVKDKNDNKEAGDSVQELAKAVEALESTGLDRDALAKVQAMAVEDAIKQAKEKAQLRRITNILGVVFIGAVVVGTVIGVIGLTRLVFGF